MPSQPTIISAGPLSQQDLDDADIPAIIVAGPGGMQVQLLAGAGPDDLTAIQDMIAVKLGQPVAPSVNMERAKLTDAWLTAKACLDCLPAAPDQGVDPYADTRLRLASQVQIAETAMNNAGGPG